MEQRRAFSVMQNTLRDFQKEVQNVEAYTRLLADSGELKSAINDANKTALYELLIPAKYYARQQKVALYDKNGQLLIQLSNSASRPPEEKFVPLALAGVTTTNLEVTDTGMDIYAVTPVHYDPHKTGDKIPAGVLIVDRHITDQDFAVIKNREGVEITVFKEGKPVTSTLDLNSQKDLMAELTQAIGYGTEQ